MSMPFLQLATTYQWASVLIISILISSSIKDIYIVDMHTENTAFN